MMSRKPKTIDEYIAACPVDVQDRLERIRAAIRKAAPAAEEAIKYGMPTFVLNGNLVFFAAFKNHIGFFGASTGRGTLKDALSVYAGPKGSLKFLKGKRIPFALISKTVTFRVWDNLEGARAKKRQRAGGRVSTQSRRGRLPDISAATAMTIALTSHDAGATTT
jgi:uncharacterized protein YdhG (YjbR/CyaY superfamily)